MPRRRVDCDPAQGGIPWGSVPSGFSVGQLADARPRSPGRSEVWLNGKVLFEAHDQTFKNAGKIGLWTKADSVTYFDDFSIQALQ